MSITDRINGNLQTLFNIEDPIYKALICDKDGTNPETVSKPTDIDLGVIASEIEYLRRLSVDLIEQMYIDQASGEFLKYQLEEFFDSLNLEDENDVEWVQRTISTVFQQKVSRATIIYSLRPYSTQEPEITNVVQDSAFADFSYAGRYASGTGTLNGSNVYYSPAIAENYSSSFFSIKITLYNTASSEIWTVQNILRKMLAAGISYTLEVVYT